MKFRTEYEAVSAGFRLNPEKPVLLTGSCFADNITQRMQACGWNAQNPFGVLFNPLSIAVAIRHAMSTDIGRYDSIENSVFECMGVYHSWLCSSKKSASSRETVINNINDSLNSFRNTLKNCEALFVTFGTAWCYFLADQPDYVVANCHKQPQQIFSRRRIGIEETVEVWRTLIESLRTFNPDLKIVFTVSPVRHLKDGFADNARSKATLLLAVDKLCEMFDFCHYFPAYEIVNDDLRDYRFYASDLTHPSEQAVEYIWEKFLDTFIDNSGREFLRLGEKAMRRANHRPII